MRKQRHVGRRGGIASARTGYYHRSVETVSFKLPQALRERLIREAKRRRIRQSELIREALEKSLGGARMTGRELTCATLAGDLVGSVVGPRDLSTNPVYLKRALTRRRARRTNGNR